MREWLGVISEPVIAAIDAIALLAVVVGTAEVSVKVVRAMIKPLGTQEARIVWQRYARWLVAALTFHSRPTSSKPPSVRAGRPSSASGR